MGWGRDKKGLPSIWAVVEMQKKPKSLKKAKYNLRNDGPTDIADCRVACTRLKRAKRKKKEQSDKK